MTAQRYSLTSSPGVMFPCVAHGDYVRSEDYDALLTQRDALVAALEGIRAAAYRECTSPDPEPAMDHDWVLEQCEDALGVGKGGG